MVGPLGWRKGIWSPCNLQLQVPTQFSDTCLFQHFGFQKAASWVYYCCYCLVAKSCQDSLKPHGLYPSWLLCLWDFPGKILEWVAISFSQGSSRLRLRTHVCCIGRQILYYWATRSKLIWDMRVNILSSMYWATCALEIVQYVVIESLSHGRLLLQLHGLYPARLFSSWDFPVKSTGVGSHFLL